MLLHCSQGVSRSASLAIAYLMWKQNSTFDSTLAAVKAIRGVANPNIGFTCQVCAPCHACNLQKRTFNCLRGNTQQRRKLWCCNIITAHAKAG